MPCSPQLKLIPDNSGFGARQGALRVLWVGVLQNHSTFWWNKCTNNLLQIQLIFSFCPVISDLAMQIPPPLASTNEIDPISWSKSPPCRQYMESAIWHPGIRHTGLIFTQYTACYPNKLENGDFVHVCHYNFRRNLSVKWVIYVSF